MQGKGFVKVVAVILLFISLYSLFFTWKAAQIEKNVENNANAYVESLGEISEEEAKLTRRKYEQTYLDSIYEEPVFNVLGLKFSYKQVKQAALKLGLDLQGGMSVVLEADIANLVHKLSDYSQNAAFLQALEDARREQRKSQTPYIDLFAEQFKGSDDDFVSLFLTFDNESDIESFLSKSSNEVTKKDIVRYLKDRADNAFESTYNIIQSRIDQSGLLQPNFQKQDVAKRILIEIPGVDNPKRVRDLITASANLEFYETYKAFEFSGALQAMNQAVKNKLATEEGVTSSEEDAETETTPDSNPIADLLEESGVDTSDVDELTNLLGEGVSAQDSLLQAQENFKKEYPLFSVFQPVQQGDTPQLGYSNKRDTAKVNEYLSWPEVQAVIPPNTKLVWSAKPFDGQSESDLSQKIFTLYALKSDEVGNPLMDGEMVTKARQEFDPQQPSKVIVNLFFSNRGADEWADITGQLSEEGTSHGYLAVVLDNQVFSAPRVKERLDTGQSYIEGQFTVNEAKELAKVLNTGSVDVPARIIEEDVVGSTLSKKSINKGLTSLIAGLVLILLFMVFYYGKAGLIADIALLFNMILVIGTLAAYGSTLTLPGIAGLVLTIGMAVDANVITFERVKEELRRGSSLSKAVHDGYKHSLSAIADANITTFIIAMILGIFGIGPIRGFAVVLIIGIITSFFTAYLATKVFKDDMLRRNKTISYWTPITKNWFSNLNFDFISKRHTAFIISGLIVLAGLISMFTRGFDLGVDLSAGRSYVVKFDENIDGAEIKSVLDNAFGDGVSNIARTYGGDNQIKITTTLLIDEIGVDVDEKAELQLFEALKNMVGEHDFEKFKSERLLSSQKVDSTIADDLRKQARILSIFALGLIFLYLLARFLRWQYGTAAVVTLIHDSLLLLGVFSLFKGLLPFTLEVDQAFIAALLTIIGYSINDTVVVFDRIREFLKLHPNKPYKEVINAAINSTLSRTIMTSVTTLLVILVLFIFGGEVIKGFSFALLLGVIVGTYSSIFVATPIVVDLYNKGQRKEVAKAKS